MGKNTKGTLILVFASMIWGMAFVAQDMAAESLQANSIICLRSFIATLVLTPVLLFMRQRKPNEYKIPKEKRKIYLLGGVLCGFCLFAASGLQQMGVCAYPDTANAPARAGFLTSLYVVMVPLVGLFFRKKVSIALLFGVMLSFVGLYLLCLKDGFSGVYKGDLFLLASALCFTVHIMVVDWFVTRVQGIWLSAIQFLSCGMFALFVMLLLEKPALPDILSAAWPVLYLGVMSSGVAYTLQIIGQNACDNPTVASIAMSLESVFAALGGVLFGNTLTMREGLGCVVMFAAILLSQVPSKPRKNRLKS